MKNKYCKLYKKTHYYIPIFCRNMNIVFNEKDFKYIAEKYFDFEYQPGPNGFALYNQTDQEFMIGIFNKSLSTLNHELFHILCFLGESVSFDIRDSYGEQSAHISQHLFEEVYNRGVKSGIVWGL